MNTTTSHRDSASHLGGETPIIPGEEDAGSDLAKTPPVSGQVKNKELRLKLDTAWADYMVNGFENTREMFEQTLKAYMRPYAITIAMYVALFITGIGLFIAAAILGFVTDKTVVAVAFGGLSVASFLIFFIRQPVQALEENLEFITWLGIAFNTYWTRLMYMQDSTTLQADLQAATEDFGNMVERLIDKHASLRAKRSGGESSPLQPAGSQTNTKPQPSQGQTASDKPASTARPAPPANDGVAS